MRPGEHVVLRAAAKLYAPLMALFAAALLATRDPGAGIGFIAGLAASLALILHVIVFGADAARAAFPGWAARACLSLGLLAVLLGAGARGWAHAPQALEAGLFLATLAGAALIIAGLVGRAPSLRDESW
jgi:multisubunit Na+/H+ antiporter MnhB subunit